MTIVIEISRPFQWLPLTYCSDNTVIRVAWLLFAISIHFMRYDEIIDNATWDYEKPERYTELLERRYPNG